MTYLYPESELVGDAAIRLATYYYKDAKRYDVSARIYKNFQERFPNHEKAPRALFMCGSCYVKQAEKIQAEAKKNDLPGMSSEASMMYLKAAKAFDLLTDKYRSSTTPELKAQALYWAGDVSLRRGASREAYIFLKRTVLEYPETDWARRARGLLLQESQVFQAFEE
jgi:TolA-binding protein